MIQELSEYLEDQGYDGDVAVEIQDLYYFNGIETAVESFRWTDDDLNNRIDYTPNMIELRNHILNWQNETGEDGTFLPKIKIIVR